MGQERLCGELRMGKCWCGHDALLKIDSPLSTVAFMPCSLHPCLLKSAWQGLSSNVINAIIEPICGVTPPQQPGEFPPLSLSLSPSPSLWLFLPRPPSLHFKYTWLVWRSSVGFLCWISIVLTQAEWWASLLPEQLWKQKSGWQKIYDPRWAFVPF